MRILVTGGAGFIGSHLCDRLLAAGHHVVCLDNLVTGSLSNRQAAMLSQRLRFVAGDVQDEVPAGRFDRIYNLACPASPRHNQADRIATMRTNVIGAMNVLERALRDGATVLQASTSEVYGDPEVNPQVETYVGSVNCCGPRACYDEGKRAAETLFYDYHRQHGARIRVARILKTYGPRMGGGDGRVIPNFICQALRGEPITVYGSGQQTRSFCFIEDMVAGLVALMEADGSGIGPVNLGNPGEMTIGALAQMVIDMTVSPSRIEARPLPEDDPRVRRPSIDRALRELRWRPATPLEAGLSTTIDWYRTVALGRRAAGRSAGRLADRASPDPVRLSLVRAAEGF